MAAWLVVPLLGSVTMAPTVLPNVPRIGWNIHLCPFIGSVDAALQYLKDPVDYDYLMGVSGACFRRFWNRDDGGNVDLMYLSPEPQRRLFEAIGYDYETIRRERPAMLEAIQESIGLGRPVIGFGLIGPPEAGLVCGYEEDGAVLRGWSYFQEPGPGYYRLDGWFEKISAGPPFGLIVLGPKRAGRADQRTVLRHALEWAIDLARRIRRPARPDHVCGLAAYEAWAAGLEQDDDYPAGDETTMATRVMVHADQATMLYERREAARFIRRMAPSAPEADEPLLAAAALYDEVAGHVERIWPWADPAEPRVRAELAEPDRRRRLAAEVRAAGEQEARAVALLEQALKLLGGEPAVVSRLELQPSALVSYPRGFTPNVEDLPLPSALRAVMEFVGEDFGYTTSGEGGQRWRTNEAYPYFVGLSGEAFDFRLPPAEPGTDPVPDDLSQRLEETLAAAGFGVRLIKPVGPGWQPAALRTEITASIAERGWPILVFDLPRAGSIAVVTGYEEGGRLLHGWSVEPGGDPGIRFESAARERWADWETRAGALLLLDARRQRMERAEACRRALRRGARLLRARSAGGWPAGPAAYETWAARLSDGSLSADDPDTVRRRTALLSPAIWDLAERRWYGSLFLAAAAEALPGVAPELSEAATCFKRIHDLMWAVNRLAGAQWPLEAMPSLGSSETRRQIAELLTECRDQDQDAARQLEQALAKLGL